MRQIKFCPKLNASIDYWPHITSVPLFLSQSTPPSSPEAHCLPELGHPYEKEINRTSQKLTKIISYCFCWFVDMMVTLSALKHRPVSVLWLWGRIIQPVWVFFLSPVQRSGHFDGGGVYSSHNICPTICCHIIEKYFLDHSSHKGENRGCHISEKQMPPLSHRQKIRYDWGGGGHLDKGI